MFDFVAVDVFDVVDDDDDNDDDDISDVAAVAVSLNLLLVRFVLGNELVSAFWVSWRD